LESWSDWVLSCLNPEGMTENSPVIYDGELKKHNAKQKSRRDDR